VSANEPSAGAPAKPSRWPLLVILVLLLALAGASTGWYLSARTAAGPSAAAHAEPLLPAPALYYALEPAFVVNLDGAAFDSPQYLQVEVQLMTRDPRLHALIPQHAPALRARLLLLFAQQSADAIGDRAGKERLQAKALEEVRTLLRTETGSDGIDALLFTSFITQ